MSAVSADGGGEPSSPEVAFAPEVQELPAEPDLPGACAESPPSAPAAAASAKMSDEDDAKRSDPGRGAAERGNCSVEQVLRPGPDQHSAAAGVSGAHEEDHIEEDVQFSNPKPSILRKSTRDRLSRHRPSDASHHRRSGRNSRRSSRRRSDISDEKRSEDSCNRSSLTADQYGGVTTTSSHHKAPQRPPRCTFLNQLRRRLAPRCRAMIKNKVFQIVMFANLLIALFLPDLWLVLNVSSYSNLDVLLTCVFLIFIFELIVQVLGHSKSYIGSFYFWMDVLGAASLLLDFQYLPFAAALSSGGNGADTTDNAVILRLARVSKISARAGRFTRLGKFLRFLPGIREGSSNAGTAKVISTKLIAALSMRVSCIVLLLVMLLPLFNLVRYPEQDFGAQSWLQILDKTASTYPARLPAQLKQFDVFHDRLSYYPWRLSATASNTLPPETLKLLPHTYSREAPPNANNAVTVRSGNLECVYNFQGPQQMDSLMNICLMLAVMVLMVIFSVALSTLVTTVVLQPLEKLLLQVRKMASTIFQSVTDMTVTMPEEEDEDHHTEEETKENEDAAVAFGNETDLLERVVRKLAALSEISGPDKQAESEHVQDGDRSYMRGALGVAAGGRRRNRHSNESTAAWRATTMDGNAEASAGVLQAQKAMIESAGLSLDLIESWNLNPLEMDQARNKAAGVYFFGVQNFGVVLNSATIESFLGASEAGYVTPCSYHTWFHALDVAHCVYRLLRLCACEAYLNGIERLALLASAICHDVGHPAFNNAFLIENSHDLALLYNDRSPLESFHCAKMFEIVSEDGCNIFETLTKQQMQDARKICIDAILHTDNTQHFSMIREVQMMYEVNSEVLDASCFTYLEDVSAGYQPSLDAIECFRQPESRHLFVKLLLHLSDVSNSMKPFRTCRIWASQLLDEHFAQGDVEKRLGVPVQPLNDRDTVSREFSQVCFIDFLVAPMLFAVFQVFPPLDPLTEQTISNAKMWHQHWLCDAQPTPTEKESNALSERIAKLDRRLQKLRA
eukprot:TRINITY_DN21694_c0_g1_i1.p1 TRINITY_DN21694_c0_g1~~TRINITY_DN21694_c0_g1_i1.p1  ORF type:complete len:1019 (+),score=188.60 TRINITY_DN21694_c0_g1_i1:154-3210(+)